MNISYKNMLGELITPQQVNNSSKYQKIYNLASGDIKKRETYLKDNLAVVEYYIEANETEEEIVNSLASFNCTIGIINRETYGDYIIEHQKTYISGVITGKSTLLFDSSNNVVCDESLNLTTNQPDYQYTQKYLGEIGDVEEDYYCRFTYHTDGSFNYCEFKYLSEYDSEHFDIATLPIIKDRFMLSYAMYNYYLIANLLPPLT